MEDVILQILEDTAALQPVNDLMIEGQEHVHHHAGAHRAVRQDGGLQLGTAEAADAGLGRVDDGGP